MLSDPDEVASPGSQDSGVGQKAGNWHDAEKGAERSPWLPLRGTRDWAECRFKGERTSATAARSSLTKLDPCFPAARCRLGCQQADDSQQFPFQEWTLALQGSRGFLPSEPSTRETGSRVYHRLQASVITKKQGARIPGQEEVVDGEGVGPWQRYPTAENRQELSGATRRLIMLSTAIVGGEFVESER